MNTLDFTQQNIPAGSPVQIILTAPHNAPYYRANLTGTLRQAESWTGEIAHDVASQIGAGELILQRSCCYDPNYDRSNSFKDAMMQMISPKTPVYHIDLHGMQPGSNLDFAIYYPNRFGKSAKLASMFRTGLDRGLLRGSNIQIFNHARDRGETLSEKLLSSRNGGASSVQIEIAKELRDDAEIRTLISNSLADLLIAL